MKNGALRIDGTDVREGTSIYDTAYDRVLWVSDIDEYELTVEVVDPYHDDDPIWWSAADDPTEISDGASIDIDKFETLVESGRFEIGAQPRKE